MRYFFIEFHVLYFALIKYFRFFIIYTTHLIIYTCCRSRDYFYLPAALSATNTLATAHEISYTKTLVIYLTWYILIPRASLRKPLLCYGSATTLSASSTYISLFWLYWYFLFIFFIFWYILAYFSSLILYFPLLLLLLLAAFLHALIYVTYLFTYTFIAFIFFWIIFILLQAYFFTALQLLHVLWWKRLAVSLQRCSFWYFDFTYMRLMLSLFYFLPHIGLAIYYINIISRHTI